MEKRVFAQNIKEGAKMKKLFYLIAFTAIMVLLAACEFHSKQAKDDTYYKRTQSVAWPGEAK